MSDNIITRDVYKKYANKIVSVLKDENFYEQFKKRVDSGASNFKLGKKRLIQDISIDWIDTIEEVLPNLDTIVRNPRRFIVQEEDIVDISLARSISTESVKYLAQHTNMISKVDEDGMVTPSKILNITKEESFEIYENRFIYTLLLKLKDFVTMRYDKIKKASATQDVLELNLESRFNLPSKKVTYCTEYFAQLSFDEVMRLDPDTLTKIERVAKIDRIITDFLSSSFAKSMRNSAPVRPPIMRTNVILKEPNFKKALTLWQFIETYNSTGGFSTSDEVEDYEIDDDGIANLKSMVTLNTMLFESLYDQHEVNMDMEDKQFGDFLRVGDMDFQKDEINRDEYAQKLDNQIEDEREQENIEEVKPQEEENAETEMPPETPQPEEKETVKDKEVVQEVEVERPVEVERLKEMPPKADQEEVDLEPDAEKFDQHLFDVRKLYKRPDDDKLKQEDIMKVRDAIDRCLTSYRRIKQEEIDERDRQEQIRRRKEEMEKRAAAFKKQREQLESVIGTSDSDVVYFGIDPFSYQKAKLAGEKKDEEFNSLQPKLKIDKNEKLDLDDNNLAAIVKEIDDMESSWAKTGEETKQPKKRNKQPEKQVENEQLPEKTGEIRIAKDTEAIDPWSAPTTKSKTPKNITAVDESKVQVGGITFKDGSTFDDPFGAITSNKAEERSVENGPGTDVEETTEPKPRKPRKKRPKKEEPREVETAEQVGDGSPTEERVSSDENPTATTDVNVEDGSEEHTSEENERPVDAAQAEYIPNVEEVASVKETVEAEDKSDEESSEKNSAEEREQHVETVQPESESDVERETPVAKKAKRSAKPKAENGLSPTTVNQKYSKPSGRKKNITAVDESKVQVGGITFKGGSALDDPFSFDMMSNKAEEDDDNE